VGRKRGEEQKESYAKPFPKAADPPRKQARYPGGKAEVRYPASFVYGEKGDGRGK
jgi:hypothetical protein